MQKNEFNAKILKDFVEYLKGNLDCNPTLKENFLSFVNAMLSDFSAKENIKEGVLFDVLIQSSLIFDKENVRLKQIKLQ